MRILCPDSVSQFRIRKSIFLSESIPATLYPYLESGLCIRMMYPDSAFGFSINPYSVTGFRIPYPYLVSKSVSKERLRDFTPILALSRTFVYIFSPVFMNLKDKNKCKNWQLSNKKFGSRWRLSNTNGKFCIFWISFVMFWLILGLPCWVCFCHVFGQPLKKWRILKANPSKFCFLHPFWGSLKSLLFPWRFLDMWLGLLSAMVSFFNS